MVDDLSFSNMDSWKGGSSNKFGLTFKQIVLMHINRCVQNGSVEWHGGYWNETGNNPTIRSYIHNSREVYNNSIKMLRACLLGYYDKKIEEIDKELSEEYASKLKEYATNLKEQKEEYVTNLKGDEESDKKDNAVTLEWLSYKVEWHIRLFEQLIMLSKRLNFFEEESTEEEV